MSRWTWIVLGTASDGRYGEFPFRAETEEEARMWAASKNIRVEKIWNAEDEEPDDE